MASNHEDTPNTVGNVPPQEKPTEKQPAAMAPPAHETTAAAEGAGNGAPEAAVEKTEAPERPAKQHGESHSPVVGSGQAAQSRRRGGAAEARTAQARIGRQAH